MKRFNSLNNKNRLKRSRPGSLWPIAIGLIFSCAPGVFFGWTSRALADNATSTVVSTTTAAETDAGSACTPDSASFAKIEAIQNDPALGYLDEIKAELAVRKQLLTETIICAENEAKVLKTNLMAIAPSQDLTATQSELSGQLDEATSYYGIELQKADTAGLSGTEAIARDVLSWREGNYAPLAESVSNFILWSDNQAVFETAQNRLEQVQSLVGSVPFSENAELQGDFQEAVVSLQSAEDENTEAGQAFAQSAPPDQTLALIQGSLNDLATTYQHFFDISNLAQTLLPH
jgi:hypothetical protein